MRGRIKPEFREMHSHLIHMAAELVRGSCIPDTDSMIRCKTTPRKDWARVSRGMDGIADRLRLYGIRLKDLADSLPREDSASTKGEQRG